MFVVRLLSIAVKFALVAAVIVGGAYVYENRESIGKGISGSGSGSAAIDYNCSLPGSGFPWLVHEYNPHPALGGAPYHLGGIFQSTVPRTTKYGVGLPVRLREDGKPYSMAEVYRMLCAVHPDLGGSGLRPMTREEKRRLDFGDRPDTSRVDQVRDFYTDGIARAPDEAHIGFGQIRLYYLPPIPRDLLNALATAMASRQTATPMATPTPAPETRRYRVTVAGYENALPIPVPDGPLRAGVRFDYRLIGEFELVRATPSKPWTAAGRRVVTADLKYKSLYPADRCQVTLKCQPGGQGRACRQLHKVTTLRLRVRVDGDEIIVSWGAFKPQLKAAGTCMDPSKVIGTSYEADQFQKEIGGERMPLQDSYAGPEKTKLYQGHNVVSTSFTYGLERLP